MDVLETEAIRIAAEYERRRRDIPADFYSWAKPANLLKDQQIQRACIRLLHRHGLFPLDGKRVADIGCGGGTWLLEFVQWGADPSGLAGLDLMSDRIERARLKVPQADLRTGSAAALPWEENTFDLVSQFMLFTNIFDPTIKREVAKELLRVLKPGGALLWLDMRVNNPRNPQILAIGEREIRALFPGCAVSLESVMLATPIARSVTRHSWTAAEFLHLFPILRTHYAGIIRKPK